MIYVILSMYCFFFPSIVWNWKWSCLVILLPLGLQLNKWAFCTVSSAGHMCMYTISERRVNVADRTWLHSWELYIHTHMMMRHVMNRWLNHNLSHALYGYAYETCDELMIESVTCLVWACTWDMWWTDDWITCLIWAHEHMWLLMLLFACEW